MTSLLADFIGSTWYYVILGAAVVVLIIIWRVMKARGA